MRHFPAAYHRPQLDAAGIALSRVPDFPVWVDPSPISSFREQRTITEVRRLVSSIQYSVHGTAAAIRFTNVQLATMRSRIRALAVHLAALLRLLDLGVDRDRLELWHHDVDGREGSTLMDWPFTPMATSNSPTCGHPKFPQARRADYDDSGLMAIRAAASLRR